MKETPASLAEQILNAIDPVLPMPLTESRETELVNAILGVINPLCNEVARLEAPVAAGEWCGCRCGRSGHTQTQKWLGEDALDARKGSK